jgi:hypothetical protein
MPLLIRVVSRATPPHLPTLNTALAPLLAVANAGAFHSRYQDGAVVIEQNDFTGVDWLAVEAAVAAAPVSSDVLDVKTQIAALPLLTKAIVLALMDAINVERSRHGAAAITPEQAVAAIVAKVDAIS